MKDFYDVLEVSRDASYEEIRKSYKKLAKKYHPDLNNGDEEAEKRLKEINVAYEILSDEQKRKTYDLYGEDGINGNFSEGDFGGFGGFGDIFGDIFDMFGGGFRDSYSGSKNVSPTKGQDIRYDITLDFREAVFGVERVVNVRRQEVCSRCDGTGAEPGTDKHTCDKCRGSGQVKVQSNSPFGSFIRVVSCDKCDGTGEILDEPCHKCHGIGKEVVNKKINVKIPAGVDNNTIISMKGEGHSGENGGPSGDLFIYVSVKEDSVFKRSGSDLHLEIPITYMDAVLGGTIKVPTLTNLVDYEIPKGTQGGTTFKLKNEGVSRINKEGKGDLYFTVDIIVPKKINDEQRELLETLREKSENGKEEKKGFFNKFKELFE
ncbi:molecular chaperone DnaJ [Anaerosphaera multitolerans]|uniref:Chaperone protein DnaJ n=1 Tax=Anaerosphaera multitolerans TaxID=2487351 RepID=A0A437S8B7_9FIRM|nr:molecular chaperone DnaJ [Anaerosphaera multitolerans]RVU55336.1 molecular chaperone DnaJ [Anaerosphaera multitolerans]